MSYELPPSPELNHKPIDYAQAITAIIGELPHMNPQNPHSGPSFQLPELSPEDAANPAVVYIEQKYVQYVGTTVEAPKQTTFFYIPHWIIGRTDGDKSLLITPAQVEPYESAEIKGIVEDPREVLLPKAGAKLIITKLTPTIVDRLRNAPVDHRRKKLARTALGSMTDISRVSSSAQIKTYRGGSLSVSSKFDRIAEITDEIAEKFQVPETLDKLVLAYTQN
ncbi:MAG: hypothetical protein ABI602_03875 [Candidatus Saccharibacteria bacterium]